MLIRNYILDDAFQYVGYRFVLFLLIYRLKKMSFFLYTKEWNTQTENLFEFRSLNLMQLMMQIQKDSYDLCYL